MDFFQSQDRARRNTKLLLGLYVAAVVCIILLTNVLVVMVGGLQTSASMGGAETGFSWGLFLGGQPAGCHDGRVRQRLSHSRLVQGWLRGG